MTELFTSAPVRVTLFEDRAEVVRRAAVQIPAGTSWIRIGGGLTPFVDDRSVRVDPGGAPIKLLGARVVRTLDTATNEEAARERAAELSCVEHKLEAARQRERRGEDHTRRLSSLLEDWSVSLAKIPLGLSQEATLASWRAAHDAFEGDVVASLEAQASAHGASRRAEEELGLAAAHLAEARAERPRCEARIEVQVEASAATDATLEVTYRTPCALWRPEHLARLTTESDEAPDGTLDLITHAVAWQRTGEAWNDVEVSFSTARPGRVASAPTVPDDLVVSRDKSPEDRKRIVVSAREQEIQVTGIGRGARTVEEMPGVDDGGEPLTFRPAEPVSLASDGRPFRVEVSNRRLTAGVVRVLIPEVAPVAHLSATSVLDTSGPLLAGPVRLARSRAGRQHVVGRAPTRFVGPGEPFELGFGPDDAVRVRRNLEQETHRTAMTGTQRVDRTVTVYLSNLSTDTKTVRLTERVPVSDLAEVEVSLTQADGWSHDPQDGFISRLVELAPRDTQELSFAYQVKAGSKVTLPF